MPRGIYIRTVEACENIAKSRRGTKTPEETKQKLREIARAKAADPEWRQYVSERTLEAMAKPGVRERHLEALQGVFSRTENGNNFNGGKGQEISQTTLDFAAVLCPVGYLMDEITIPYGPKGRHYTLDFGHPKAKVDIELDGSSHRGREEKDRKRDEFLRNLGWKVIRIKV